MPIRDSTHDAPNRLMVFYVGDVASSRQLSKETEKACYDLAYHWLYFSSTDPAHTYVIFIVGAKDFPKKVHDHLALKFSVPPENMRILESRGTLSGQTEIVWDSLLENIDLYFGYKKQGDVFIFDLEQASIISSRYTEKEIGSAWDEQHDLALATFLEPKTGLGYGAGFMRRDVSRDDWLSLREYLMHKSMKKT